MDAGHVLLGEAGAVLEDKSCVGALVEVAEEAVGVKLAKVAVAMDIGRVKVGIVAGVDVLIGRR